MQRSFEREKGRLAANGALWVIRNVFVFFACISLYWDWNDSCINNLATLSFKTLITQELFKSCEEFFYQTCFP